MLMARSIIMPIDQLAGKDEADYYLEELFKEPAGRSMDVIYRRARDHIEDPALRMYFVNKGEEMLEALSP
jgi:hypothetical protein